MRANQIIRNKSLLLLLALVLLAYSCSEKDNVVSTSNDYCYISSVILGNVKRKVQNTNVTFSAVDYEMTINQRTNNIENRDSLPYGSQLSRVIATIHFDGSTLAYREKGSNSEWTSYNATDSLDLTKPLELFLTSNDNQSSRIYTLKVNVHQQEGDSLFWKQCDNNVAELTDMTDMKAFVLKDKLFVLGQKTSGITLAERSSTETEGEWTETLVTDLPTTTDIQTLRQYEDMLYLSTNNGSIFSSADAKGWRQEGSTYSAPLKLVEKTEKYYYAISEGKILRSADASTWEEESLDTDATMLPTTDIRALSVEQANGNNRIILVGQSGNSDNAVVWNKMWNDSEQEENAEWIYFPITHDNNIPCPRLEYLNLLSYDGKCIAFGGASIDNSRKALETMYVSQDYGITWRPDKDHRMPVELKGIEGCITSTVDENYFIWIITNAQVWRGRLNRLGFAQQ